MNEQISTNLAERPIFRALLVPHRSLGWTGFVTVMTVMLLGWGAGGLYFLARGAWPVFVFMGLAVIGVFAAFWLNYRSGRRREEITVSRSCLEILQVAPSGSALRHCFNPFWTRFTVSRDNETGISAMAVSCRGTVVPIGGFLNPDDRESFAAAFARALARAQG